MKKNSVVVLFLVAVVLVGFNPNLLSLTLANQGGNGYEEGDGESSTLSTASSCNSIENYIIQGGAAFFSANESMQKILRAVELQDSRFNYFELDWNLFEALNNITVAIQNYERLINKANSTPYNQNFIASLKAFDYRGFAERYRLNTVTLEKVSGLLEKGDITGLFKQLHSDFVNIHSLLYKIWIANTYGNLPDLPTIWSLGEAFADVSLKGTYSSRVFYSIR